MAVLGKIMAWHGLIRISRVLAFCAGEPWHMARYAARVKVFGGLDLEGVCRRAAVFRPFGFMGAETLFGQQYQKS